MREIKVYVEGATLLRYEDEKGNIYFDEFGEKKDAELTKLLKTNQ